MGGSGANGLSLTRVGVPYTRSQFNNTLSGSKFRVNRAKILSGSV